MRAQPVDAGSGADLHASPHGLVETARDEGRLVSLCRCRLRVPEDDERVRDKGTDVGRHPLGLHARRRQLRAARVEGRRTLSQEQEREAHADGQFRGLTGRAGGHPGVRHEPGDPGLGVRDGLGGPGHGDVGGHSSRSLERLAVRERNVGVRGGRDDGGDGEDPQGRKAGRPSHGRQRIRLS